MDALILCATLIFLCAILCNTLILKKSFTTELHKGKTKIHRVFFGALLLLSANFSQAQEEYKEPKFAFKGYLKNMSTLSWSPYLADTLWYDNLTHNRLNFAWYPNEQFTLIAEMRNRIFMGSSVKTIPNYSNFIDSNNDYFDLSINLIDNNQIVINLMLDRLYVQWAKNDWEVKLGRQRINWGVNLAWNPNDWFNAYSFFDFDYEERPGSDALRITHYTGIASSIEIAAKIANSADDFVAAAMYKTNAKNYDFQFLGGLAQGDVALGTGWAGNLGSASLKGELTYFVPVVETTANTNYLKNPATGEFILDGNEQKIKLNSRYTSMFLGAISVDYSFANSLYFNGSVMYNSIGNYKANLFGVSLGQQYNNFTVRDLSPYPWSSFIQATYQFSPLLFGGGAVMVYPGTNNFFINPMLSYSVVQNVDVDVVGQLFFGDNPNGSFDAISKALYIRAKWSF